MKKNVAIFGGSGFIGSHLASLLIEKREIDRIFILDLEPPQIDHQKLEYIYCDVREKIDVDIKEIDKIYNLAAIHRTPGHEDKEYYETNIYGAINVCNFARENEIRSLVFTSSIAVYGSSESSLDESSRLMPDSAYGASKKIAESIHAAWVNGASTNRLAIVRPGVVFGRGEQGNFSRLARALKSRVFVFPGSKNAIKSSGYVKDLISSFAHIDGLEKRFVIYNYCFKERFSIEQICKEFAEVDSSNYSPLVVPAPILLCASVFFELANSIGLRNGINRQRIRKLMNSTNIVPNILTETNFEYQYTLREALLDWKGSEGVYR